MLDLSHLFLTNDIAERFSLLPNLTELNVAHCRDLGNQGALTILRACPQLQVFIVTGCPLSTLGMLRLHRMRRGLRTWTITEVGDWGGDSYCSLVTIRTANAGGGQPQLDAPVPKRALHPCRERVQASRVSSGRGQLAGVCPRQHWYAWDVHGQQCLTTRATVVCVVITVHWTVLALAILLLCVLFSPLLLFMLASALISTVCDWIAAILLMLRRAIRGGGAAAAAGPAADAEGQDEGWEVPV